MGVMLAPTRRVRVEWSDTWTPALDQALDTLPEMPACPHDLYRAIATNPSSARKRFALVTDGDTPIAAVALRRRHRHWELVTDGVVPFAAVPAAPQRLWDALAALRVYVRFVEWPGEMPTSARFVERSPSFAVSTRIDLDAYWAAKGNRDWLKKTRRRTEQLGRVELEVDQPDAARWTIEGWHGKWRDDGAGETTATEDILVAADYLRRAGRQHAFRLLIDGKPVAGVNTVAHGDTLVMTQSYRDSAHDRAGVGVQLDERIFRWAATSPYERVNLGCGGGYKARWAEESGMSATFALAPAHLALARNAATFMRGVIRRDQPDEQDIILESSSSVTSSASTADASAKRKLDSAV